MYKADGSQYTETTYDKRKIERDTNGNEHQNYEAESGDEGFEPSKSSRDPASEIAQ